VEALAACAKRLEKIPAEERTDETNCVPFFFDYVTCQDKCLSERLFEKLK
jgi:hypothetical protein